MNNQDVQLPLFNLANQENIENEFARMYKIATAPRAKDDKTDHFKIVQLMYARHPNKIWWFSHEFEGSHDIGGGVNLFLSIECASRLSELAKDTKLIESRKAGKYMLRRLRVENYYGMPYYNKDLVDTTYSSNNNN